MKKKLCLLMAVAVICAVVSGCGGNTGTTSELYDPTVKVGDTGGLKLPLTDEAMTINWQVVSSETGLNDSWFIKKLRAVTGVDVELNVMPASTVNEKLQANDMRLKKNIEIIQKKLNSN